MRGVLEQVRAEHGVLARVGQWQVAGVRQQRAPHALSLEVELARIVVDGDDLGPSRAKLLGVEARPTAQVEDSKAVEWSVAAFQVVGRLSGERPVEGTRVLSLSPPQAPERASVRCAHAGTRSGSRSAPDSPWDTAGARSAAGARAPRKQTASRPAASAS